MNSRIQIIASSKTLPKQAPKIYDDSSAPTQTLTIKAFPQALYEFKDLNKANQVAPRRLRFQRFGQDLHIFLNEDGPANVVIENYFDAPQEDRGQLLGLSESGTFDEYLWVNGSHGQEIASLAEQTPSVWAETVTQIKPGINLLPGMDWIKLAQFTAVAYAALKVDEARQLKKEKWQEVQSALKTTLDAINDALASGPIDGAAADTAAKIQVVVNAYAVVLAQANDVDSTPGNNTVATTPNATAQQYAAIGAQIGAAATDAVNLALLNDIVAGQQTAGVDTIAEINELARIANAIQLTAADGTATPALNATDFAKVGLSGVTVDNLPAVLAVMAAKNNDGSETDSLIKLQTLITATAAAQSAAIDKIADFAETCSTPPSDADYTAAGVAGVTSGNVSAINDAINSQTGTDSILGNANDRAGADTTAKVQAIVDAYNAILAEANDTTSAPGDTTPDGSLAVDPTATQYAQIGADIGTAKTDEENLSLLNDIVGGLQAADVDTIAEINELARIANAIQLTAANGTATPALNATDFSLVGLTGVTADNLPAVLAAIAGQTETGSDTDSLSKLQAVITTAAAAQTAAINLIGTYAEANTQSAPTAPTGVAPDTTDFSAAGVTGVDSNNLSAINDALATAAVNGAAANTTAQVQAIVNAYNAILAEANGAATDATPGVNPSVAQYALIGADIGLAASDADNLALLNDIVAAQAATGVDNIAEINELARIANALQLTAANGTATPALTPADFTKVGLNGVTADNLPAVLAAIAAKTDAGTETDSLSKLQTLVTAAATAAANALGVISNYAETNTAGLASATGTAPSLNDFTAAAVNGVNADNLSAIRDALASSVVNGEAANTRVDVQGIVDAYIAILSEANGSTADAGTDPTSEQYTTIGVTGVTAGVMTDLLGDVIGSKVTDDVDTVSEVQNLANAVAAVMANAAGTSTVTVEQLQALGIAGVTTQNIAAVQAAIAATNVDGTGVDSQTDLQTLVNTVNNAVIVISTYAQANTQSAPNVPMGTAPTEQDYTNAGVTGFVTGNLSAINDALASGNVTGLSVDTPAEIQTLVNAYNAIIASADGTDNNATAPTTDHYAAIGVTGVDSAVEVSLLADVIDLKTFADIQTVAQVQALADAVQAVMNSAAGLTPTATVDQLALLGVTGVTAGNLSRVLATIASTPDGGSAVSTLSGLQAVADVPQAHATLTSVTDDFGGVTGPIANNGYSDDANPTLSGAFTGTLVAGQVIAVYDTVSGTRLGTATVDIVASTWTFTPASPISTVKADVSFQAVVENAYGLRDDSPSAVSTVRFDNTPLTVLSKVSDAIASVADLTLEFNQDVVAVAGKKIYLVDDSNVTSADEAIIGSAGADTLTGGGGVDRFFAGMGNDTIVLTSSDITNLANTTAGGPKASVHGGGGFDTLRLSGGANLNLMSISNVAAMGHEEISRIESIERIDLATDTAANTLTLSANDVKDMADLSVIRTGGGSSWVSGTYALGSSVPFHQMVVEGSANDALTLTADRGNWVNMGTVSNGSSTYNVYQNTAMDTQVFSASAITNVAIDLAPTLVGSNPSDNGYLMAVGGNLTLTFNEPVSQGAGIIGIYKTSDNSLVESFNVASSGLVTGWNSNTLTINPTNDLLANTGYHIKIASAAVKDTAGNAYAGILDATTLNFTTVAANGSVVATMYTDPTKSTVGFSVSSAGDVNGDGYGDYLVGGSDAANSVFVVYGDASGLGTNFTGGTIAQSKGFKITSSANKVGMYLSGVGDVNGDGFDDVLLGSFSSAGAAYVVYGGLSNSGVAADSMASSVGYKITGKANSYLGSSISGAGDVNGDGLVDFIVGAYGGPTASTGNAYVVYGKTGTSTGLNLNGGTIAAADGFQIVGGATSSLAYTVSAAGDVNGDGLSDLILGGVDKNAYVVYGNTSGATLNLSSQTIASSSGFKISSADTASQFGWRTSSAGDVNGDGLADLLVSSVTANSVYVVFGNASGTGVNIDSTSGIPSGSGFRIWSASSGSNLGYSVSSAGDVNGDGLSDVIVGSFLAGVGAYVVYGKSSNTTVNISSNASIAGSDGFRITGLNGTFGYVVSAAGDINGDGLADLLAGSEAHGYSMVLGGTQWVTSAIQGSGAVSGTSAAEALIGSAGHDTLTGGGGVDRFFGGLGNDTVVLSASDITNLANTTVGGPKASVHGGAGFDTLRLTGGAALDLTTITNVGAMGLEENSRIESIERIDLATDTAANTLTLAARDVNDMAGFNLIRTGSVSADGNTWTNVTGSTRASGTLTFETTPTQTMSTVWFGAGSQSWQLADGTNSGDADLEDILYNAVNTKHYRNLDYTAIAAGNAVSSISGSFKFAMNKVSNNSGDGLNFSFGDASSLSVNFELGYTTGLSVKFGGLSGMYGTDTKVRIYWNGVQIGVSTADIVLDTSHTTSVTVSDAGVAAVLIDGTSVASATISGWQTVNKSGWEFGYGGRTGLSLGTAWIDDFTATANTLPLSSATNLHQLVVDGSSNDTVVLSPDTGFWSDAGTVSNGSSNYTVYQNAGTNSQVLVKSAVVVTNNDSVAPVVLDLNRDGQLSYSSVTMDVNGDGHLDTTAWAAASDGVLVWDKYADGLVHNNSQYAFAQYATTYRMGQPATDLQGLADAFDSNRDGVFDAQDAQFAEFKVWQDADQDGVSDAGEVRSLSDWGMASINLVSDGVVRQPAPGVTEAGRSTALAVDGSTVLVGDVSFEVQSLAYRINPEGDLSLLGAEMALDLASFVAAYGVIQSVDLSGTGGNTFAVALHDVLSSETDGPLRLTGDEDDCVVIKASEWVKTGNVEVGGQHYAAYASAYGLPAGLLLDPVMLERWV